MKCRNIWGFCIVLLFLVVLIVFGGWIIESCQLGFFLYFPPALFKSLDSLEVDLEKGELRKNRRFREKMYHWIIEELKNQLFNLFPWDFRITEIARNSRHIGRTNQSLTSFKTHQKETVIFKYIQLKGFLYGEGFTVNAFHRKKNRYMCNRIRTSEQRQFKH